MKKIALLVGLLLTGITAQAQWKVGVNAGIPVGDVDDFTSFSLGADVYRMFGDPDQFFNLGATVGYWHLFGESIDFGDLGEIEVDDIQFLPVAAAARITIFSTFFAGADVGYAFGLSDGNDGGFYYRPLVGIDFANALELNLSYQNVSDNGTASALSVGLLYEFGK